MEAKTPWNNTCFALVAAQLNYFLDGKPLSKPMVEGGHTSCGEPFQEVQDTSSCCIGRNAAQRESDYNQGVSRLAKGHVVTSISWTRIAGAYMRL